MLTFADAMISPVIIISIAIYFHTRIIPLEVLNSKEIMFPAIASPSDNSK